MKVLKEYRLNKGNFTTQTFYIPKNAEIVNAIDRDFEIAVIAACDYPISSETELRSFKICCTNETVCEDNIRYIGCVSSQHVIEIL